MNAMEKRLQKYYNDLLKQTHSALVDQNIASYRETIEDATEIR